MGDPKGKGPYNDPHDFSTYVNPSFTHDTSDPSLASYPSVGQPSSSSFPPVWSGDGNINVTNTNNQIEDPFSPLYDPALLEIIGHWDDLGIDEPSPVGMQWVEQSGGGNVEGASSSFSEMLDPTWPLGQAGGVQTFAGGNSEGTSSGLMPTPVLPVQAGGQTSGGVSAEWPSDGGVPTPDLPPESPPLFQCSNNCQVLREIIHSDGNHTTKLIIHGAVGAIYHATFECESFSSGVPRQQMMDFNNKTLMDIKQFLQHYCESRSAEGWTMLADPLADYYRTLAIGFEWYDDLSSANLSDSSSMNSGEQMEDENESGRKPVRSHLARQRRRTAKMTLSDLEDFFHLPIDQAAKQMSLCTTVLKRICRKYNMGRWPQRKVKSIGKKLTIQRAKLNSNDPKERVKAEAEIHKLQKELDIVCKRVKAEKENADAKMK